MVKEEICKLGLLIEGSVDTEIPFDVNNDDGLQTLLGSSTCIHCARIEEHFEIVSFKRKSIVTPHEMGLNLIIGFLVIPSASLQDSKAEPF